MLQHIKHNNPIDKVKWCILISELLAIRDKIKIVNT